MLKEKEKWSELVFLLSHLQSNTSLSINSIKLLVWGLLLKK